MRFLTNDDARLWCTGHVALTDGGFPEPPSRATRYARGPVSSEVAFSRQVEAALRPRESCLLWVTTWGVWRSSENLHLYYRLRQSYGDQRLLAEAPAHLFLDYEAADLVSFLQVGLLNGWDIHLIPDSSGYARAFVSHDEFVEFAADTANPDLVDTFAASLGGAEIRSNAPSA
jgi:hypothetical protein